MITPRTLFLFVLISIAKSTYAQTAPAVLWQVTAGGTLDDYGASICTLPDGESIVVGSTSSQDGDSFGNHGMLDILVLRLGSNGVLQWRAVYGGGANEGGYAVEWGGEDGIVVM